MDGLIDDLASSFTSLKECCVPQYRLEPKTYPATTADTKEKSNGKLLDSSRTDTRTGKSMSGHFKCSAKLLLHAAERGDSYLILSLDLNRNSIQATDPNGNTALHLAAQNGRTNICQLLCQVNIPRIGSASDPSRFPNKN